MQWKQLLMPVKSLTAEEARKYIAAHKEGTFTLLDVRQPKEYKEEHIPGCKLVPLPELSDQLGELDPESPTIVYCAIGGRSRVAAQILSGQGFKEVYNLKGGIKAWQGQKAVGLVEEGMSLLRGDESPAEILILAYGLEEGLESFYRQMASRTKDEELTDLFTQLALFEEQHKQKLFTLYQRYDPSISNRLIFEERVVVQAMEGGLTIEEFLEKNAPAMQTIHNILDIAMMIEAQAYDLYSRYSEKSQETATRTILFEIANQEKAHLKTVGKMKDTML